MKVKELITYGEKSKIKAGEAIANSDFMFFTSSSDENKRYDDYQFDCEAIVMGTGGNATLHYYNGKFAVSTDCLVLLCNEVVRTKYLYYFFKANMSVLEAGFKGAGLKHTNKGYIGEIEIGEIPDFTEQDRIVEVLDKIVKIISEKNEEIELLDELVKSRFVSLFGDPIKNDRNWDIQELNEVVDVRDGTHDSPKYYTEGYPFVTSKNLIDGKIDFSTCNLICEEDYKHFNERSCVDDGDILMPMIGTIGGAIVVKKDREFSIKNVALIKFNEDTKVNRIFALNYLNSDFVNDYFKENKKGGTQQFVALGTIRKMPIIIPPIELQNEFAEFVEKVDKSKFKVQESLNKTQMLFDSLMQEYFG